MLTKVKTRRDAESTNVNAESIKTRYTPHRNSDRDIYIFLPGEISSRRRGLSEQSPCIVEMSCWVVVDFSAVKLRFGLKQKAQDGLPSYLNPPSVRPPQTCPLYPSFCPSSSDLSTLGHTNSMQSNV